MEQDRKPQYRHTHTENLVYILLVPGGGQEGASSSRINSGGKKVLSH